MTINVTKYRLNPDRVFAGTRGSFGMEKLSFDFDDSWDFEITTVTFYPQRGKPIRIPYLTGREIDIPAEVMAYSGESRFVVSGTTYSDDGEVEQKTITLEGLVLVANTLSEGKTRALTPGEFDLLLAQAVEVLNETREDILDSAEGKIVDALRAAKESGEFDGKDGITPHIGENGSWWIGSVDTGIAATQKGDPGKDGYSPSAKVEQTASGVKITVTDESGTTDAEVLHGKNGESVTVTDVKESSTDGGTNTVTFSDGMSLNVKNGSKGSKGDKGDTGDPLVVTEISESDADGGVNVVKFSDGSTLRLKNGSKGSQGNPGTSVTVTKASESDEDGGTNIVEFSNGMKLEIKNGRRGATGAPGDDGKDGISATHSWQGTVLTVTSASGTSSADLRGEKGDKGDAGEGLDILGTYATLEELAAAITNPEQGDMYNVGVSAPYSVYMWDAVLGWTNQGKLQGEPGAVYTPSVDANGDLSWANNGGLTNPPTINIKGGKGDPGDSGVFIGTAADMPDGTKVRVDPSGKIVRIPVIDDTLTRPGAAADAAKVGAEIDSLSEAIGDLEPVVEDNRRDIDGMVDISITPASANLFDKDQSLESGLIYYTGETIAVTNLNHGTIPVEVGKTYTFPIYYASFGSADAYKTPCYDADGNYLGWLSGTPNNGNTLLTLTISDSFDTRTAYVKVNVGANNLANIYVNTYMFVEGTEYPSEYVEYSPEVRSYELRIPLNQEQSDKLLNPVLENVSELEDEIQTVKENVDDLVVEEITPASKNLYDKNRQHETGLIYYTGETLTSGVAGIENISMPVEVGKTYTFPIEYSLFGSSQAYRVVCYDASENYLGYIVGTADADNKLLTVGITDKFASPVAYVKINVDTSSTRNNDKNTFMFVEGAEYPSEYIPYSEEMRVRYFNGVFRPEYISSLLNPLYGKTIIWNGDSICAGKAFDDEGDAWAGRIANRNSMTYKNYAVGGGTITENVPLGGSTAHSICGTVDTMFAQYPNADYIIFEGGTNDADLLGSQIGGASAERFGDFAAANGYTADFDRETFCGALESVFSRATEYWKGKKIGYIVAHKMGYTSNGYTAQTNNRRCYFETAMQICRKWGIPVLNLWDECYLNPYLPHMYTNGATWEENLAAGNMYADGQHLLSAAYDYTADIINNWLKTL